MTMPNSYIYTSTICSNYRTKNNEKLTDFGAQPTKNAHTYAAARHIPKDKPMNNKCKLPLAMIKKLL